MRIERLLAQVPSETACAVVTVVQVQGSAPRGPGTSMVVTPGAVVGTIGGGRLEHEAIERACAMLADAGAPPILERIPLGPHLGQCCGGVVTLWTARVDGASPWRAALETVEHPSVLATVLVSAAPSVPAGTRVVVTATAIAGDPIPAIGRETIAAAARRRLVAGDRSARCERLDVAGGALLVLLEPDPDLGLSTFVFGAGHVGRVLVPILAHLPGRVTWIDARDDAFPEAIPTGVDRRVTPIPEDDVDTASPGASFVVLTHDHALDLRLAEAILRRTDFAYFGLIGSATKRARFERRLRVRGIAAETLAAMRCPIGVDGIGGKAPGEIAVAIAAELLRYREPVAAAAAVPARERLP